MMSTYGQVVSHVGCGSFTDLAGRMDVIADEAPNSQSLLQLDMYEADEYQLHQLLLSYPQW